MQASIGDRKAVCPSIRLSAPVRLFVTRVHCDETKAASEKKFNYD